MKIILNKCYGGFNVSDEAHELYAKKKGITLYRYYDIYERYILTKTKRKDSGLFTYYFTKDYGEWVKETEMDDNDWETYFHLNDEHRTDPTLIEVVEELGEKASGNYSKLKVVEIPDGMDYVIDDYDGFETLHEDVKVW